MQPSMFNVSVPLPDGDSVFLMNTFTDAQAIVSREVADWLRDLAPESDADSSLSSDERETMEALTSQGFLVPNRGSERQALEQWFAEFREDTSDLRVTLLTTLQCNFACDYCFQGDHGDYNKFAHKMSLETADRVAEWIEERLDTLKPSRFVLTFFGGEPLLNLPVMYALAERLWHASDSRGVPQLINIITNGLLLTPEVVDRLEPFGLNGVKITLDGDRETHDRMRPLRGRQGTFDRIIENIRQVAGRCKVAIGGNFDESSVDSFPALLDFLREQSFAPLLTKVAFKPVIRSPQPERPSGLIPLTAVDQSGKPLGGTCMTSVGSGGQSPCDTCGFVDEKLSFLREETRRRGFPTTDGVHMGPCELHRQHAYTIGPEGSLYACPGFTGETSLATGHIDGRLAPHQQKTSQQFDVLAPWKSCGDCAFIPVCAGGCSVASHTELGDMHAPSCHKTSFETALVSFAHEAAGITQ